eukprot:TRINITY_DN24890_c0_g1_i1.p1 TRINITY_DN24890_c0_g1~~TRINITY_DN24890_c0_g1_i1.p1  ORF type:complete len:434 (+),score=74.69 TRINITY_DN24890_c0_g1_i1:191-1303(+)
MAAVAASAIRLAAAGSVSKCSQILEDTSSNSEVHLSIRHAIGLKPPSSLQASFAAVQEAVGVAGPYAKELGLLRHVLSTVRPRDPAAACHAIEDFSNKVLEGEGRWLKIAGDDKAQVLLKAVRSAPVSEGGVLEIGTYCGYSSILMASILPEDVRITTLEVDPVHAIVAINVIAYAGLSHRIDVLLGHSRELLPRMKPPLGQEGKANFSAVFMDQRGSRYDQDLKVLEQRGLLAPGAVIVADNVLKPGAPLFLWRVTRDPLFETEICPVKEFAMPAQDWMSVSRFKPTNRSLDHATQSDMHLNPPSEILQLHQESDRVRAKALGQGRSVTYTEWAKFARWMQARLAAHQIGPEFCGQAKVNGSDRSKSLH